MSWFSNFFSNLFSRFQKVKNNEQPRVAGNPPPLTVVYPSPPVPPVVGVPPVVVPIAPPVAPPVLVNVAPYPAGVKPEDVFYRADGTPDPMGQYHAYQLKAVARDARQQNVSLHGPVPVESLTDEEKSYLYWAQSNVRGLPQMIFYMICSGQKVDIDRAIGWADSHMGQFDVVKYEGRMKDYIAQIQAGNLKMVTTNN